MSAFIDQVRDRHGVEPVCRTLGVSVSAYYQRNQAQHSARAERHRRLAGRIRDVHRANYGAYGYRRMWKALQRAGEPLYEEISDTRKLWRLMPTARRQK